jgi:hypothetical protein
MPILRRGTSSSLILPSLAFGLMAPACLALLAYSLLNSSKNIIAETAYIVWVLQLLPGIMIFGPDPKHPLAFFVVSALWNLLTFSLIAFAFLARHPSHHVQH